MSGETDLNLLLASMCPSLCETPYVFVTTACDSLADLPIRPVMTFREKEGLTCIVTESEAAQMGCAGAFPNRMITLNVHSSLEAVGLLARITTDLAGAGISINAVSAFYHDYLFVPAARAQEAMSILAGLTQRATDREQISGAVLPD